MKVNIEEIANGNNTQKVVDFIRKSNKFTSKDRNEMLTPISALMYEVNIDGKQPNSIKLGLVNAYYNGLHQAFKHEIN